MTAADTISICVTFLALVAAVLTLVVQRKINALTRETTPRDNAGVQRSFRLVHGLAFRTPEPINEEFDLWEEHATFGNLGTAVRPTRSQDLQKTPPGSFFKA